MAWDPIHETSPPGLHWSRNNTGEAVPGVLAPLGWHLFGRVMETSARRAFYEMGILSREQVAFPAAVEDRMTGIFHGRYAINAAVARDMFSGLPGVTGEEAERDLLGYTTGEATERALDARSLRVLAKAPRVLVRTGPQAVQTHARAHDWWARGVGPEGPRPGIDARVLLTEACAHFGAGMHVQARTRLLFQAITAMQLQLAERAGLPEAASSLTAAAGVEEAAVADDIWRVATGALALDAFLAAHGFHGPNSGHIATRSWREDATPLTRLFDAVSRSEPPAERRARGQADRARTAAEVLRRLPAHLRPGARLAMRWGPGAARGLELGKTTFLTAMDGARAAARALGDELVARGHLDEREHAFLFLPDELLAGGDLRETAAERAAQRERHRAVELPLTWVGNPEVETPAGPARTDGPVVGLGVSPGSAEGRVRVVLDAADDVDIDPGDVLVTPTTDPSWVSLMTIAGALVIDIGTAASHGAVVARELGVPCVIGTRTGTQQLRDGDLVRVDGTRGTVERV